MDIHLNAICKPIANSPSDTSLNSMSVSRNTGSCHAHTNTIIASSNGGDSRSESDTLFMLGSEERDIIDFGSSTTANSDHGAESGTPLLCTDKSVSPPISHNSQHSTTSSAMYSSRSMDVKSEVNSDTIVIAGVKILKNFFQIMSFRSPDAVIADRKDVPATLLPSTLGPHDTMEDVRIAVRQNYKDNFAVIRKGLNKERKKKGFIGTLLCAAVGTHGKKDDDVVPCPWKIVFECTLKKDLVSGTEVYQWYFKSINDIHCAHKFSNEPEDILSDANRKGIPKLLLEKVKIMCDANMGCQRSQDIHKNLIGLAAMYNMPVTWDIKNVRNTFATNIGTQNFDAQGFREIMATRSREDGLEYYDRTDEDGRLSLVIAELKGGRQAYAIDGDRAVLLYDTTHGTNMYAAKLGLLCVVDRLGRTTIIAVTIITENEDGDKFRWLFEKFLVMFKVQPSVILTDSCSKQAMAISEVFTCTRHLLCVWHISKNFFNNIHPIVGREWNAINKCFWMLAKESDNRSLPMFDSEFETLTKAIENAAAIGNYTTIVPEKVALAMKWLKTILYEKREKWAYRWTWSSFTAGCHASQRSESLHAAIKSVLRGANFSLIQLFNGLVDYQSGKDLFNHVKHINFCKKMMKFALRGGNEPSSGFLVSKARNELNDYGFLKFQHQFSQKDHYLCTKVYSEDGGTHLGWMVKRRYYEATVTPPVAVLDISGQEVSIDDAKIGGNNSAAETVTSGFIDDGTDDSLDLDTYEDRFVSVEGLCSCQYKKTCGICCRHACAVSSTEQVNDIVGGMCDGRFLQTIDENISASRMLATRVNTNSVDSSGTLTATTIAQRTQALTAMSFQLIGIAKVSESGFRWMMKEWQEQLNRFSEIQPHIQIPPSQLNAIDAPIVVANPVKPAKKTSGKRKLDAHDHHKQAAIKFGKKKAARNNKL